MVEILPPEVTDLLPDGLYPGKIDAGALARADAGTFLGAFKEILFEGLDTLMPSVLSLFAVVVFASLFRAVSTLRGKETAKPLSVASLLAVAIVLFRIESTLVTLCADYLSRLVSMMNALTPVLTVFCAVTGNVNTANVSATSMLFFLTAVENLISVFFLPIARVMVAVSALSHCASPCRLSGIAKALRKGATTALVLFTSIFSFILVSGNLFAKSADSLAIRAARFAVGSAVPIVGTTIGETIRTTAAGVNLVRDTGGILGAIALAFLFLPILFSLCAHRFLIGIVAAIAKIVGCDEESALIDDANDVNGFLTAVTATVTLVCFFGILLFLQIGGNGE